MDKDLISHVIDIKQAIARIEAVNGEMKDHLYAVSKKADNIRNECQTEMKQHKDDEGAHGIKAFKWIASTVIALAGLSLKIYSYMINH